MASVWFSYLQWLCKKSWVYIYNYTFSFYTEPQPVAKSKDRVIHLYSNTSVIMLYALFCLFVCFLFHPFQSFSHVCILFVSARVCFCFCIFSLFAFLFSSAFVVVIIVVFGLNFCLWVVVLFSHQQ